MNRIAALLADARFTAALEAIDRKETDRIYCRHGIDHLLDTARIAYILTLERGEDYGKELIYAAALTHDLGRAYADDGHAELGAAMCADMLVDHGFTDGEISVIRQAVAEHRGGSGLAATLHEADGLSRRCWSCGAADGCNWSDDRKNKEIEY